MKQTEVLEISIGCGEECKGRGNIVKHKVLVGIELHNIKEPFRGMALEAARKFEETLENIFAEYQTPKDVPHELKTKAVWDAEKEQPKRVLIDET